MSRDFENCACYNVRRTARRLAQVYDHALEPVGLKNTQFTLLAMVANSGPLSITELSRALELERTTLTRNLRIMERQGLLVVGPGADARTKTVIITRSGRARLRKATPLWRAAQSGFVSHFGARRWAAVRSELEDMLVSAGGPG